MHFNTPLSMVMTAKYIFTVLVTLLGLNIVKTYQIGYMGSR